MNLQYKVSVLSNKGNVRQNNEDNFFYDGSYMPLERISDSFEADLLVSGEKHVFAVFDGMGGIENGEIAAGIAAQSLKRFYDFFLENDVTDLSGAIQGFITEANQQIFEAANGKTMGTTIAMLVICKNIAYAVNVGDSRIYKYARKKLAQISKDCTQAQMLYDNKIIKKEQLETHPGNNTLTQFLGMDPNTLGIPQAEIVNMGKIKSKNIFLLASDGFYNEISFVELQSSLQFNGESTTKLLFERVLEKEAKDNVTVVSMMRSKQKKTIHPFVLVSVLICTLCFIWVAIMATLFFFEKEQTTSAQPAQTTEETKQKKSDSDAQPKTRRKLQVENESATNLKNFNSLAPILTQTTSALTGTQSQVSYSVKDLQTGEELTVNNRKMYAASLIKLYIMAEIYRQTNSGELQMTEDIQSKLNKMITVSDNDCANALAEIAGGGNIELGMEKITKNAADLGCQYTVMKNRLRSTAEPSVPIGNFTCVQDCAIILEKIYSNTLVSAQSSQEMLSMLKNQQRRGKIPKYLPAGTVVANKTGEISKAQNDVGIVYSPKGNYIVCIMLSDYTNDMNTAMDIVAKMSKNIYDCFVNADKVTASSAEEKIKYNE